MLEFGLKEQARSIFAEALRAVDAGAAVRRAVKNLQNSLLTIAGEVYELTEKTPIYSIAVGKAAYPMATALDKILGGKLKAAVISGVLPSKLSTENPLGKSPVLSSKWRVFAGGHPLPNEASLAAAQECFNLLGEANDEKAMVIFLISGGGSAMLESPSDDSITLADLREANRILVSCGASIGEINLVRRAFSRVKGGGLAAMAPHAAQISLIVSDTETGDEKSVASGLTYEGEAADFNEITTIIERYDLSAKLPPSIVYSLSQNPLKKSVPPSKNIRRRHVLLDNQTVINAAAEYAESRGLNVKIAADISRQSVEEGSGELVKRTNNLLAETDKNEVVCLISGGEFSCPVRGDGTGGRNSETVLRTALISDKIAAAEFTFLSAGTDGIDGNSFAAGAICDEMTLTKARDLKLNARRFLETSDSAAFFQALGDTVVTQPTGTNVCDLRIMLARK